MRNELNRVIAGDYKNSEFKLKGENSDELALVVKKFMHETSIIIDKTMIKRFTHSLYTPEKYEVIIEWYDGKLSQVRMDQTIYSKFASKVNENRY